MTTPFQDNESIETIVNESLALTGEVLTGAGPGQAGGSSPTPEETGIGDLLATVMLLGGEYVAGRLGDHWKFSTEEVTQVGKAWDKWAASASVQTSPFWTAIGITGAVMVPRVLTTMMEPEKEPEKGGDDAKKI